MWPCNINAEDTEGRSLFSCNRVCSSITLHLLPLRHGLTLNLELRKLLEPINLRICYRNVKPSWGFYVAAGDLSLGPHQGKPFHPFQVISPDPLLIFDN